MKGDEERSKDGEESSGRDNRKGGDIRWEEKLEERRKRRRGDHIDNLEKKMWWKGNQNDCFSF